MYAFSVTLLSGTDDIDPSTLIMKKLDFSENMIVRGIINAREIHMVISSGSDLYYARMRFDVLIHKLSRLYSNVDGIYETFFKPGSF